MRLTRLLALLLPAAVALSALAPAARAVVPPEHPALPDFDVRGERAGRRAVKTPQQAAALRRLRSETAELPGGEIVLVTGPEPGTLHHLYRRGGFLSAPGDAPAERIALGFIARHRDLFGLSSADVRALELRRVVADPGTGARHAMFQQRLDGLPVFLAGLGVHLDATGRVLSVSGNTEPLTGVVRPDAGQAGWMAPSEALARAAAHAGLGLAGADVPEATSVDPEGIVRFARKPGSPLASEPWASRAWFPQGGDARPAWVVTVDASRAPGGSWHQVVLDAGTGELLHRFNLVRHAATEGLVFRQDPDMGSQVVVPFVDGEVLRDDASPFGWSAAGRTTGNNCDAKDDLAADNEDTEGWRAEAATGPPLSFSFPFQDDPSLDLSASITNLFYLNNWLHDRLARMGFDEASGNFQAVNASGQGRGGDPVRVDAQDGSGRNNANFGTPPDGFPPRMQMFVWTFTNPWRDSGFDGSVVTHELLHGVSNRMVGLAARHAGCLGGPQGGAMGEAWSDFFPCSFWDTPVVGAYVVGNPIRGIRRAPYDAYPYDYGQLCNQGGFEVHRDGEIWAAILWDLRELFIARHGLQRGRCLVERLVLDGMKLAPCDPTYVDMRDAILLAARLRGDSGDECLLWQGFAARGLGVAAVSQPACTSAADASFDVPPECAACGSLAPPSGLVLDASQPNRVVARFAPAPGATAHLLLRSEGECPGACAEASFVEVARGAGDATSLQASDLPGDPMSAGMRFAFRVVALQGACTAATDCQEAVVVGRCTLPPMPASDRAGLLSVGRPPRSSCAVELSWAEARAACGASGDVRYNVYRSADPAFTPGPEHLVASVAAPATSFTDETPEGEVTYVVRAEDLTVGGAGPHGGNEERNDVRLSVAPVGPVSGTTTFSDDCEAGERAGYRRTATLPVNDWAVVADANTRGGSAWHAEGVEGGNAEKSIHLPPLSLGAAPRLRFAHAFRFEDAFDGGVIEISVDRGETWRDLIGEIVAGGYETSRGAGYSLTVGEIIHPPNTDRLWTGENASGFPNHDLVEVDLSAHAGTADAQLRFRMLVDPLVAEPGGWYVDDIEVEDVLAFDACVPSCGAPPLPALPDAEACVPVTAPAFAVLDASGTLPGASPLRAELAMIFTHDGPGSFGGRRWAEGPVASLEFPPGTPPGDYPVTLTVRDERGCGSQVTAVVRLLDETLTPAPVGDSLRVARSATGLVLSWGETGAPAYNVHAAPFGADLGIPLWSLPPWTRAGGSPASLDGGAALPGAGSLFLSVHAATDCGRSVP